MRLKRTIFADRIRMILGYSIIRIRSATILLFSRMVKYCNMLAQNSSWWWTVNCSKHVEDNLCEIYY